MSRPLDHKSNNIDAIRLILSLLVLFSHSYPLATGSEDLEPLRRLTRGQLTLGSLAVDWFFVLSGYLITMSWERSRSAWSFLTKRVRRIYPGYLVSVSLCLWVVIPIASPEGWKVFSRETVVENIWPFLTLRGFRGPQAFLDNPAPFVVNGSLWSISYEFWCYIGVVLLGTAAWLRRRRLMLCLFLSSILVHFLFESRDITSGGKFLGVIFGYPRLWARLLPLYLAGVMAYLYREQWTPRRTWALACLAGLAIGAVTPYGLIFALPTLGTYLLLYLAFTADWKWHGAARYGDFSYGVYLYAFPIQQIIMMRIGRSTSPYLLFGLALIPTLLAGVLSWYVVERRFLGRSQSSPVRGRTLGESLRGDPVPASSHGSP